MNLLDLPIKFGTAINKIFTRQIKLPAKVVSVGNISFGGRAKTPLVIEIVNLLYLRNFVSNVAVSSRLLDVPSLAQRS